MTTSVPRRAAISSSRRVVLSALFAASASLWGCAAPHASGGAAPPAARQAIAPTGELRVAVYPGSPTSLVENAAPENMRGISVDLGRSLAARLGVPAKIVVFPRVAEMVAAVQRGDADFTITNATEERAKLVDFAQPVVDLELGVLVPQGVSRITSPASMDQPGATIGVSLGSSSERALAPRLKQAKLRTFPNLDAAAQALQRGEIDAFATNKGILFELSGRVPGSRVLDGRWGEEHVAPALPKGRPEAGLAYLRAFTQDVQRSGELDRAAARAGLRGTIAPAR
ncbi:MAG: transporter substrate-binding domain-containing protein [Pseudomonadota bacterium]